jgi:YVTN family beta-propeller protein
MTDNGWKALAAAAVLLVPLVAMVSALAQSSPGSVPSGAPLVAPTSPAPLPPGISPSRDPTNLYADTGAGMISPAAAAALPRVYVPNVGDNSVYVIDPATAKVVDRYPVPGNPQHVIPSWDMKTLWVASSAPSRNLSGALTPIDPLTGKAGKPIVVRDAYNMYFTPDGTSAVIVAELMGALEFRDPQTMKLQGTLDIDGCDGLNHADFSLDGAFAIFTCEFGGGGLVKVDISQRKVVGKLKFAAKSMPQDIRSSPDGSLFFVADMLADGLHVIDSKELKEVGFIPTGVGTHALYPSRDGKKLYVVNRGSHSMMGQAHGQGSISVLDFASLTIDVTWAIPGGGSPDMGNVSADGSVLWLAGRYDDVVYAIDTLSGAVKQIPVGQEPHGLTVWPQPGRYSLGHTGVMR